MKKFLVVIAMTMCICASAQTPAYREPGYKGNIYAFSALYYSGVGTSHGFMFNEHHYLGASIEMGVGLFTQMDMFDWRFSNMLFDYRAYISKKSSTPIAGMRLGYTLGHYKYSSNLLHGFHLEPQIGWSWEQASGHGITLTLGAKLMREQDSIIPVYDSDCCDYWGLFPILPTISLSYEF